MAFFDELSKKLSGVSRVAVRKAKEVTDIGSLKLQIADENRKLSKIYENLGREYYDRFQDEAAEELSGLVKQIKDSTDKIAALQDEISRVEAESAARAEEERVRREAEAQARRESVAEAEMREVDEDEGYEEYEDEEAKKNGEMTGYEEETTGEEAAEYTDETEDEADVAYTEGSEDEADTAYAEETEEAAEEETVAEEGEVDETAEPASEEGPGDAETEEPEQNSEWL
ncbi:Uncharacterised protein [uncultured Clostridium sp.]|nr:Uncharacterised protein [uncultured Clostridium sp.]